LELLGERLEISRPKIAKTAISSHKFGIYYHAIIITIFRLKSRGILIIVTKVQPSVTGISLRLMEQGYFDSASHGKARRLSRSLEAFFISQ
jgi:hypothetical protein